MMTSIAVVNQSAVPAASVAQFARAMNTQLQRDVAPRWQRYANVWVAGAAVPSGAFAWRLYLRDEPGPGEEGCLGYHETIGKDIVPVSYVFTKYAEQDGASWTSVASHEVLEMLGNEWINDTVVRPRPDGAMELWPREWCDAVQGYTYRVEGVDLADFVHPEYFADASDGPFDHLGKLRKPFAIGTGGYSSIVVVPKGATAVERTLYGAAHPAWRKKMAHQSRRKTRWGALGLPHEVAVVADAEG